MMRPSSCALSCNKLSAVTTSSPVSGARGDNEALPATQIESNPDVNVTTCGHHHLGHERRPARINLEGEKPALVQQRSSFMHNCCRCGEALARAQQSGRRLP